MSSLYGASTIGGVVNILSAPPESQGPSARVRVEGRSRRGLLEKGAQTVLPHEYFHLVQNAYDAEIERYFAEGTAQWAAKQLHPELTDLERFLPAYFSDTDRSLDAPPGGVVAAFLYATAIWPVFLSERHGAAIVREILEAQAAKGTTILEATETALSPKGSSLAAEFSTFATWNAATGARASTLGYPLSATYPMVETKELPSTIGASVKGVSSGLSAFYYLTSGDAARVVSIEADPKRNAAVAVPLSGGIAQLDRVAKLPARSRSMSALQPRTSPPRTSPPRTSQPRTSQPRALLPTCTAHSRPERRTPWRLRAARSGRGDSRRRARSSASC
jgi:hypothetical protein